MRRRALFALGVLACASCAVSRVAHAEDGPPDARIRYVLEGIEIHTDGRTGKRVVLHYVPFRAGDVLDVADPELDLTRYRLLATGFFAKVQLSLRKGSRRGTAVLVVELEERNTFLVHDLWFGIAADEDTAGHAKPLGGFVGLSAGETNLLGTGVELGGGAAVAVAQYALRAHVEDHAIFGSQWSLHLGLQYAHACDFFGNRAVVYAKGAGCAPGADFASVAYDRYGGTLGTGYPLGRFSQIGFEAHVEQVSASVPAEASHLRGDTREPIDFAIEPGRSWLSTLRASLVYDSRDMPFLTRRGWLGSVAITAGVPPLGSSYGYARVELGAQRWWQLPWKHVIRASAFVGGIAGSAPFFEKFYIGDFTDLIPDRVLDLTPDRRQPPNLLGTDITQVRFGEYAAKLDVEYRVPLYTGKRTIYGIDAFVSGGLWGVAGSRDISDPPSGYSGLARVPVDLTYNVGIRLDTAIGGATVAFSNLLGLIPAGSTVAH
jgi:outer membrane protein assembly factor BamA